MALGKNLAGTFMLAACLWSADLTYEQARVGKGASEAMAGASTVMWAAAGVLTLRRDD